MLTALALGLAGPASAAPKCFAPPGTAAMEQYCETVPSASGNQAGPGSGARSTAGQAGPSVSAATADQIAASVGDEATQNITGVPRGREAGRDNKSTKPGHPTTSSTPADAEANPLSAVASAAGTGAEVGGPLVYTLLALTLIVVGLAWTRFRRTGD